MQFVDKPIFLFIEFFCLGLSAVLVIGSNNYKEAACLGLGAVAIGSTRKHIAIRQILARKEEQTNPDGSSSITVARENRIISEQVREEVQLITKGKIEAFNHGPISDLQNIYPNLENQFTNLRISQNQKLKEISEEIKSLSTSVHNNDFSNKLLETINNNIDRKIKDLKSGSLRELRNQYIQLNTQQTSFKNDFTEVESRITSIREYHSSINEIITDFRILEKSISKIHYSPVIGVTECSDFFKHSLVNCKKKIIMVCPWPTLKSFNSKVNSKKTVGEIIEDKLDQNIKIDIGWGRWTDAWDQLPKKKEVLDRHKFIEAIEKNKKKNFYTAMEWLGTLESRDENPIYLKLLGTHQKYFICDDSIAMIGSYNFLTGTGCYNTDLELGITTTDKNLIEFLKNSFLEAPNYDKSSIPRISD